MLSLEEKMAIIQNTEIFGRVPSEYFPLLAKRMGEKQYHAGAMLFREGDPGKHMLIICQGQIEVIKGEKTVLATLGEGDILGEMAPILGGKRSTSARAKGEATALFLRGEALRILMHKIPDLSLGILRLMGKRLQRANEAIQSAGTKNASPYALEVMSESQQEKLPLPEQLVIGRGDPAEKTPGRLNLKGSGKSKISRRHAEIFHRGDHYFVRDLGSRNGTKVNSITLEEIIALSEGDKIQIGEATLCFGKH